MRFMLQPVWVKFRSWYWVTSTLSLTRHLHCKGLWVRVVGLMQLVLVLSPRAPNLIPRALSDLQVLVPALMEFLSTVLFALCSARLVSYTIPLYLPIALWLWSYALEVMSDVF